MEAINPLAPIFAASVAVQQILEVFSVFVGETKKKKAVLGGIGFLVGIVLARAFGLDVMQYFQLNSNIPGIDTIVTALVLSAGTEGTNSIVKFLKYLKEDKKTTAAETLQQHREGSGEAPAGAAARRRTLERLPSRDGATEPSQPGDTTVSGDEIVQTPAMAEISAK